MRLVLPIALLLWCSPASADLYTVIKNGEIYITSRPMKGARILHHVKDDPKPEAKRRRGKRKKRRRAKKPRVSRSERAQRFAPYVRKAAQHYGLPEALVWAVMKVESGFNPEAVSNKGAQGLMQLMPPTARDMGVTDPFDPEQNIYGGARYLRIVANKFDGDLVLALSAYHAGGGAVDGAGGIPYEQTAEYVRRVLNAYYAYQAELPVESAP